MDLKTRAHWLMGYGLPRATLKLLARRGDPFAKLLLDDGQHDCAYDLIEQIREQGRMAPAFSGNALVTADLPITREILRDNRFRTAKPYDRSPFRTIQRLFEKTNPHVINPVEPPSLLMVDEPDHARLRRLVSRAFTPKATDGLRHRIHEVADRLLNELDDGRSECDLTVAYASRIPIEIIADMLGIPRAEAPYLYEMGESTSKLITTTAPSWRNFQTAVAALRELEGYLAAHIERLRGASADGSILSAVVQDTELSDFEVRTFAGLLLGAGFLTTAHQFGSGVVALVNHPDQLARLQAQPDSWANAVEEILRYDSVSQIGVRVATEEVQVGGQTVREGMAVFVLLAGANRDPAVFERPDQFDATRSNARDHVSFGTGSHVCLGAPLARMELEIGLQALFERFPRLALAGTPAMNDSTLLRGISYLPVSLAPTPVTSM
ncbi:cytochrome P450 [Mycobacterium sp. SMC-18]|uniref:cytochrome P450 n=1 Tax=Mycobacterium sp. SMC-18 TaxID=3381629 RepID=UPI003876512B